MKQNQKGFALLEVIILFVVIVALVGVGLYVWQRNQNKLEYVSYNNNLGQQYKLKFYKAHDVIRSPVREVTANKSASSQKGVGLGSKVSRDGYLPIWLAVAADDLDSFDEKGKAEVVYAKTCKQEAFSTSFSVHNTFLDTDINVCNVPSANGIKQAAYLAVFTYKNKVHFITVTTNAKNKPGKPIELTNLNAYNNDLKTVLSSLEVTSQ
jgi:type II secretory pathway pseudopilin PulG